MPQRKTVYEFIAQAQAKHGDLYDYSLVEYVNSASKVTIICPHHGEFKIAPYHHLKGVGCRNCYADRQRHTQSTIIDKFREAHGDRYDYSKVVYKRIDIKVTIICPVHGDFEQDPKAHINGSGCVKCANENQTLTLLEFVEKARATHGDKYDYSEVRYVNHATKVTIVCPQHGAFEQTPSNHIRKSGCPACAKESTTKAQHGFEYKGIHYTSTKQACQKLSKNYWVVLKRLGAGWTVAQAFDDEPHDPKHSFRVNGVTYNGIEDAVRQLSAPVSSTTVKRRIAEGMTPEAALFTPPKLGYDNGIIYTITNCVNGKQYIGLTTTSLKERWERHLEQVYRHDRSLVHDAIAEFGKENFTIESIDCAANPKELRIKERQWIQRLNTLTPNGYNVTLGGEIGGSPGKPTRLPGAPVLYPTVQAAAEALAKREGISVEAAEKRIHAGRIDAKKPHGMSRDAPKTRFYKYWSGLVHGLTNPNSKEYNGSSICDRWKDFRNFCEDAGDNYDRGLYLKPVDPKLPYSKENCVWVPRRELYQTHGMTKTRIYRLWSHLVYHKANPNSKKYEGIPVCSRWQDFTLFYEDISQGYREGKILFLMNPNEPYSKENCYWNWVRGNQQAHPLFGTPIYKLWRRTVNEYCNPESKNYNGSSICDRWRDFALFCEDMASTYERGLQLIRRDRNKPFAPDNCDWKSAQEAPQTHGMTNTKFYRIWARLSHYRTNPASKSYEGSSLCERWRKFENFKEDMYNSYQEGMGLGLLDRSQPYSKDNCTWLTKSEFCKKNQPSVQGETFVQLSLWSTSD
ncbi:hypothetical protein F7734_34180 [Scytonema sp. UIC 10036]|uniref:GIY-YIG nuclease family protein n=1 Tax=Scytonema sp. UIC 10036 TaxID=2304196 RepID=UPI0012DA7FC2|nr:GIY-YIG nuclease family protein [Scytonema sp. UIC 10036]MUG97110.1 hypothetical protein [Scytonema sp. UIC 10036]